MGFFEFCGYGLAAVFVIYGAVRLGSAAYFLSRQQYEERKKQHGTKSS